MTTASCADGRMTVKMTPSQKSTGVDQIKAIRSRKDVATFYITDTSIMNTMSALRSDVQIETKRPWLQLEPAMMRFASAGCLKVPSRCL